METKDQTNEVEQEIVNPQDSATANEAENTSEAQTAENADTKPTAVAEKETKTEPTTEIADIAKAEIKAEVVVEEVKTEKETSLEEAIIEEKEAIITKEASIEVEAALVEAEETAEVESVIETTEEIEKEVVETEKVIEETTLEEVLVEEKEATDIKKAAIEIEATLDEAEAKVSEVTIIDEKDTEEAEAEIDYTELSLEQLVDALVQIVKVDDILSIKEKVGIIKGQYIKKIKQIKQDHFDKFKQEGGIEEEYESLKFDYEEQYKGAFAIYKKKRVEYIQELEKQKEVNLKKKEDLLESLRKMIISDENLNKIYKEFQELQVQWREIGLVPQTQVNNLWENYHFLVEKFFDKVKLNKELMMIGLNKNLNEKILLCERTEELLLEKSINKSFQLLQEFHTKWKEIGPVPQEKNDEIWERFKSATDKVNKRRHDYYEILHEDQKSNLVLKTALCERIETIIEEKVEDSKDWNKKTDEVNALFAEWKTLGPAPKKFNDAIWSRFKTAINSFFDTRKEFQNKIKNEQMNNYHIKIDLIAQAEAIKNNTDWKETTFEFIKLQKKWKELGPVPRKYSDKIWKNFRASCDYFFNAKEDFFKNIGQVEEDNKKLKLELIEKIKEQQFSDKQEDNLKIIKDFQRQWIEIGRVPFKDKTKLQSTYSKVVDKHLSSLNIDSFEFENAGFKTKIENMENKNDASRLILKEIGYLRSKIENMQKDVNLWDNNISFFANSKNADLLKADFEKKIAKGKKEINVFKAKIRQFDKMMRGLK